MVKLPQTKLKRGTNTSEKGAYRARDAPEADH